ncbi:MAG: peptide ABC transporter substrate-binding protein [Chloroflexi bacterium]|nr:peptide ABC transporter substrate-binding protein [Chloroflexota bacterium]
MALLSPSRRDGNRGLWPLLAAIGIVLGLAGSGPWSPIAAGATRTDVTILSGDPSTLDPALQSDIGSAAYSAQLYESLTTFDLQLTLRPALARSWDVSDDGRRIVFHLRSGLVFSDGAALTAEDVVQSWLRIINPSRPSQLASLLLDVRGAAEYLAGRETDPTRVGLRADGLDVIVDLERPGADFPSIVSSPTFGVVPAQMWRDGVAADSASVPSSGAYVIKAITDTEFTLGANSRYWAGPPAIPTVRFLTTIGGRSPVAAFEAGDVDYTPISSADAAWIRYDETLGPQLRLVPSLSLIFIGFTTDRPPFNDVRVRQAFAQAVDWTRITELAASGDLTPADSMVPTGIPGGGDRDWLPAHDPQAARQLLASAGYPGGAGLPPVTFAAGGIGPAEGIAEDLRRELGVTIRLEEVDDHFGRLAADPPAMWSLGWVADYPGANDFLGVLLGTGSSNNYGHWSSSVFDGAIADALGTRDASAALAAFERALAVVRDEAPVVPLSYGDGWALARDGLLGADENGLGILRSAGLAWR